MEGNSLLETESEFDQPPVRLFDTGNRADVRRMLFDVAAEGI